MTSELEHIGEPRVVEKFVSVSQKEKKSAIVSPAVFSSFTTGAFAVGTALAGLPAFEALGVILTAGTTFLSMSALMSFSSLTNMQEAMVQKVTATPSGGTYLHSEVFKKSKKEKVFINSFHVRKADTDEITDWCDPEAAVPEHKATHTIKQYLKKTRGGYLVEQEAIPNNEVLWDMSANALVEVYSIQENETKELSQ